MKTQKCKQKKIINKIENKNEIHIEKHLNLH